MRFPGGGVPRAPPGVPAVAQDLHRPDGQGGEPVSLKTGQRSGRDPDPRPPVVPRDPAPWEAMTCFRSFAGTRTSTQGAVPVAAPQGAAIPECPARDAGEWTVSSETRRIRAHGVFCQPKAAGDCHP